MRPRPGIRALSAWCSGILIIVAILSLAVLAGTSAVFQRSLETVARDTRSAAIADEMEVAALLYQRLANLYLVSGDPGLTEAKSDLAAQLARLARQAEIHASPGPERQLLTALSAELATYLEVRNDLDATVADLEEVIRQTSPVLSLLVARLEALRELNDRQVDAAHLDAARAQRLSGAISLLTALLLVAGFVGLALLVRRHLVQPLVALHDAMAAFRSGDLTARGRVGGARELAELNRMFNDMAETVARQRQAQLAFLAGVAHDLKNPLSTLRNGLYVLALEASEEGRGRRRAQLDQQVDHLSRMIDDLMDAARIEAGALELRCTDFDLRNLVRDLVNSYAAIAPDHRLVCRAPAHPLRLRADPLRVEQVLRNLISNAIKFSDGGEIVVTTSLEAGNAVIRVTDQGSGISSDDIPDIFLPFRRRRLNVAPGAGLGLSVVRRIVEAHGGSIDVASEVGAGSTFRVSLPTLGPAPRATAKRAGKLTAA